MFFHLFPSSQDHLAKWRLELPQRELLAMWFSVVPDSTAWIAKARATFERPSSKATAAARNGRGQWVFSALPQAEAQKQEKDLALQKSYVEISTLTNPTACLRQPMHAQTNQSEASSNQPKHVSWISWRTPIIDLRKYHNKLPFTCPLDPRCCHRTLGTKLSTTPAKWRCVKAESNVTVVVSVAACNFQKRQGVYNVVLLFIVVSSPLTCYVLESVETQQNRNMKYLYKTPKNNPLLFIQVLFPWAHDIIDRCPRDPSDLGILSTAAEGCVAADRTPASVSVVNASEYSVAEMATWFFLAKQIDCFWKIRKMCCYTH